MKYLLIALVAALLFVPFLGAVHLFDQDEINLATAAHEMVMSRHYSTVQINSRPLPPLFVWMQAGSMLLFGVNDFAVRFPNAVIGVITLVLLFGIGKKLVDERLGFWWALVSAALAILAGGWLLAQPIAGALSLTLILIAFFLIEGIASIFFALDHRRELSGQWGWMLASGIVDLVLSAMLLMGLPSTAVWALGLLVGINMLFGGIALIAMALHARKEAV